MLEHNQQREREVRCGLIFPAGDSGASGKAGQGLGGGVRSGGLLLRLAGQSQSSIQAQVRGLIKERHLMQLTPKRCKGDSQVELSVRRFPEWRQQEVQRS